MARWRRCVCCSTRHATPTPTPNPNPDPDPDPRPNPNPNPGPNPNQVRAAGCRREHCFLPLGDPAALARLLAARAALAARVRAALLPPPKGLKLPPPKV